MAFHGDVSSYPVPELLQWLDASRKTGTLSLTWDAGARRLYLLGGQVIGTAMPGLWERLARVLEAGDEAQGARVMAQLRNGQINEAHLDHALRHLAEDDLFGALVDLISSGQGQFHWTEDQDRSEDEWVSLELSLRHALFESLRLIDEAADVERALPHDHLVVQPVAGAAPSGTLARVVLNLSRREPGMTLGRLWLALGLPRGMVLRTVFELVRSKHLQIDGTSRSPVDPIAEMLEQGAILLRERQFDAAAMIFNALLQRDPSDRRVREFAHLVERENIAALYRELPPIATFEVVDDAHALADLRPDERKLFAQLHAGLDVSALVLASPMSELDTLKALARLVRLGVARPTH